MSVVRHVLLVGLVLLVLSGPSVSHSASNVAAPSVETDPGQQDKELEKETKAVALRGDDERLRPESQIQTTIGNTLLTFTGALSLDFTLQDNLNLETPKERDRFRFTSDLELNFIFSFPKNFYLFTEFDLSDTNTLEDKEQPMNSFELQIKEFFLQSPLPLSLPSAIRIGRQQFFEPRRWFLNETLDGVRLFLDPAPFHFSFSVSTPIPSNDDPDRFFDNIFRTRNQVDFLFVSSFDTSPESQKSKIELWTLIRDDASPTDENPIWIGVRTYGRQKFKLWSAQQEFLEKLLKPRIQYWIDVAFVAGTIKSQDIRGYAFDVGASYIARKLPFSPYAALGFAYGSGDSNPTRGLDSNFRQTGFQSNSGKIGGVVNYDYYGILFDPELSNLHIYTAGFGLRPFPRTSVDIVYHHYEQTHATTSLRSIDVKGDLTGKDKNLGDEIDIIIGARVIQNMRVRLRTGYFFPGPAFSLETNDSAFEGRLDAQFSF